MPSYDWCVKYLITCNNLIQHPHMTALNGFATGSAAIRRWAKAWLLNHGYWAKSQVSPSYLYVGSAHPLTYDWLVTLTYPARPAHLGWHLESGAPGWAPNTITTCSVAICFPQHCCCKAGTVAAPSRFLSETLHTGKLWNKRGYNWLIELLVLVLACS